MGAATLTPTSYAILGLLAVKPWTTYELAQQMDRALGRFWPRAESKLYEEPKKLVALGLAGIIRDGRQTPAHPLLHHAQGSARPGEMGADARRRTRPRVRTTHQSVLRRARDQGRPTRHARRHARMERTAAGRQRPRAQAYLDGTGPFPERLPWLLLVGQFLVDFHLMVERWADWAGEIVAAWPDDVSRAEPDRKTLEAQATIANAHARES